MTALEVFSLAHALSAEEKLALVSELLNDVEGPADETWVAAWVEELHRRAADPAERTGATGEDVIARAREALSSQ